MSIQECFTKAKSHVEYLPERCQIVRYLRKKHPVKASVFRIRMNKDPSLLRTDMSLNFYLARQKISQLLIDVVGKFRDYNGGIIIKQREALTSFREAFHELSLKDPDLLENFYYSLSPIEVQATLALASLKLLFELFLEARNFNFTKHSDFFLKFQSKQELLFIVIRTPDETFKKTIDLIFSSFEEQQVVTFTIPAQNTYFLGYLLGDVDEQTQRKLSQSITQALKNWKCNIEKRQILKLNFEHPVVSLDPRIGGDHVSALTLKMLFEGLMRMNNQDKLENGIAEHIGISSDQKTYLFKLRPTFWSDGSSVAAYDFEYAWKKVLSPTFKT
ncbi:MAG: ABC transporter substrate-binding protein, partial [Rhabdochlamydiaceae bacterium]